MFSLPGQKEKKKKCHVVATRWQCCVTLRIPRLYPPAVFFWGRDAAVLHPEKLNAAEASVL